MGFQFKVQLVGLSKPPVWRRLLISENDSFEDFHQAIQIAFGWYDCHLYSFSEEGYASNEFIERQYEGYDPEEYDKISADAEEIKLKNIFFKEKQNYIYTYDFGDDWEHKITLEKITEKQVRKTKCLAGKGKCPPEDCGGLWGYSNFLEILNNPEHDEYQETREWIGLEEGEEWDVNEIDLESINDHF